MPSTLRFWRLSAVVLLSAACLLGVLSLKPPAADDFKDKALAAEKRHDWLEACRWYDKALRKDRNQPDVRDAYRRCLRRLYLVRRCQDHVYREAVAKLTPSQALEVYDQVLGVVGSAYVDPSTHRRQFAVPAGRPGVALRLRRGRVPPGIPGRRQAGGRRPSSRRCWTTGRRTRSRAASDAHEEVLALIQAARRSDLDLKPSLPTAIGLEFSAGACNALDEYTLFLTPGYYNDVQAIVAGQVRQHRRRSGPDRRRPGRNRPRLPEKPGRGQAAGARPHRPHQPRQGDLTPDQAADKLRGEAGTVVDDRVPEGRPQGRWSNPAPAGLPAERHGAAGAERARPKWERVSVGYIQINHFQDSTVQDVKEALARLQTDGVQGADPGPARQPGRLVQGGRAGGRAVPQRGRGRLLGKSAGRLQPAVQGGGPEPGAAAGGGAGGPRHGQRRRGRGRRPQGASRRATR